MQANQPAEAYVGTISLTERMITAPEQVVCCSLSATALSETQASDTASLFKALADPTRVRILNLLVNSPEPVCVCEMNAEFALSQPTMSHHLKKLVLAGLVSREQRGTWAYYAANQEVLEQMAVAIKPTVKGRR